MAKSAYLRSRLLKHALAIASYTMPTNTYLALFTVDPTINNSGTEVVGGSYARQLIDWGTEANGEVANDATVAFTNLPACTITHWGIYDASTVGNLLFLGQFEIPIIRTASQSLDIVVGNLALREE